MTSKSIWLIDHIFCEWFLPCHLLYKFIIIIFYATITKGLIFILKWTPQNLSSNMCSSILCWYGVYRTLHWDTGRKYKNSYLYLSIYLYSFYTWFIFIVSVPDYKYIEYHIFYQYIIYDISISVYLFWECLTIAVNNQECWDHYFV